jgi:uridine kinase
MMIQLTMVMLDHNSPKKELSFSLKVKTGTSFADWIHADTNNEFLTTSHDKSFSVSDIKHQVNQMLGLVVDGELLDPRTPLFATCVVEPVIPGHREYPRLYQQNLVSLFFASVKYSCPKLKFKLGNSIGSALFIESQEPVDTTSIDSISSTMKELVANKEPFILRWENYHTARNLFVSNDTPGSHLLLDYYNERTIPLITIAKHSQLALHPYGLSAGPLEYFRLSPHSNGVLLEFPKTFEHLVQLKPWNDIPHLTSIYQEHQRWSRILGINTVGELNKVTQAKQIKEYIWTAEALQHGKINQIAETIKTNSKSIRCVLIAGPSSSGKTTFAKRLGIQLLAHGIKPKTLSMDNFFVPREQTPKDQSGNYDFESIDAVDRNLLQKTISDFFADQQVQLPIFDFKKGDRYFLEKPETLRNDEILILEGIHGLNPALIPEIPKEKTFRIYISALTQINLNEHHRISTTDNRLIRRLVRDYRYRGHSAENTIGMWHSVRRGEDRWIFPFQSFSDAQFNSALDYELGVLKPHVESILREVKPETSGYVTARRILTLMNFFLPIPREFVPDNSILREFVGGSAFKY